MYNPKIIQEIIFEEMPLRENKLGVITLNRPEALNATHHAMLLTLDNQLCEWSDNAEIKAVLIRAVEGKAFCAGGDIRSIYENRGNVPEVENFFRDEYKLNARIFHYPKPYIALLDGITMGGGAGISLHGSHRIATENLIFAMPETTIGFFPDIGASYFLSRLPHKIGFYLALSSARISFEDCYALGIANYCITHDLVPQFMETLIESSLSEAISKYSVVSKQSLLLEHKNEIETCFSHHTIEEILNALETQDSEWCQQTANIIKTKSPTSLKVTLRELQKGETLDFDACMKMEACLASHFIRGHDFYEGVRAVLIDKDQKPHWKPASLDEVTEQDIEEYF